MDKFNLLTVTINVRAPLAWKDAQSEHYLASVKTAVNHAVEVLDDTMHDLHPDLTVETRG
jgi:hypothetical protein